MRATLVLLTLAVSACASEPEERSERVHWLDYQEFEQKVQPIYLESCSNPSCHARPERPLSLYAPLARRMDESRTHLLEPLTDEEISHNYVVSCVLASEGDTPEATLLLRKPLGEHADTHHEGGAVFDGRSDNRYRVLETWVRNGWAK